MQHAKKEHPKEKTALHPNNLHRARYDFKTLTAKCPDLAAFVRPNAFNDESIDFADPLAVKVLNKALLQAYYGIDFWDIPSGYLCPPIPGRADYLLHIADLLAVSNKGKIPMGPSIKCLDIGVGANCIYPIIGHKLFGWSFVGTEIDTFAIDAANKIIDSNSILNKEIVCRLQPKKMDIFKGIVGENEYFDLTICNPPFHSSAAAAEAGSMRKLNNLSHKKKTKVMLNFGGQASELWCYGGEEGFVKNMIQQSKIFANNCFWFSTIISKQSLLKDIYFELDKINATQIKTIPMGQGNKISRIVAWTFFDEVAEKKWVEERFK